MENVNEAVASAIRLIQDQQGYRQVPLKEEHRVVKDLGLSSLDVAQLIATLEMELGVDPFSEGVSIMDVHTVGELRQVYTASLARKGQTP